MHIPKPLLEKYNKPVPRYTSYPPANHFTSDISHARFIELVETSNQDEPANISFYVHIPFCAQICLYCGCNSMRIQKEELIEQYIEALKKEITIVTAHIDKNRKISQIHYGGGTPNVIDVKYLKELNTLLSEEFQFIENPEIAIECHPAHLDFAYVDALVDAGFNRISMGVQDLDEKVLSAVHRLPSRLPMRELVAYIREKYPKLGLNLDFIYGLPGQTKESFLATIAEAIEIRPDRLVTFSYAHVPWVKKYQLALEKIGLPTAEDKMEMFALSRKLLIQSGYVAIGMDHYVLPGDELDIALTHHTLHRNFQGYATRDTTGQVYAFGVSAISQLTRGYIQNTKDIEPYIESISSGTIPVEKGYTLNEEEIIIREMITDIMCNYYLDLSDFAHRYHLSLTELKSLTKISDEAFVPFIEDKLLEYDGEKIRVTELGIFFIRNIAALLDPAYIEGKGVYSKVV